MSDTTKIHDYGAARLLNPQETPGTLVALGLNADNTKLEDREFYKNTRTVQELFTNEDGVFKEDEYNKFYDQLTTEFQYLNALKDQDYAFDFYERNNANYRVSVGRKSNPQVTTELIPNPTHSSLGLISGNTWSTQTESNRELAQQNQVYNSEQNIWGTETLNELGAFGVLFGDPLMYATWDDEGTHIDPMTGEEKYHQKGEWKTDQFGNFYAETAKSNAEYLDKQFVKISDVLTDDNSAWNTVDIFDSDNIEASPVKSTIRTALWVASTFIPYANIGSAIKYGTAALEFVKALPNVAKMLNGFINDETPEWINAFDNTMARFDKSKNDETIQKGFWAYENILDLVETSYMQLVQQQAIANLPNALFKYDKKAESLIKAAQEGSYFAKGPHQYEAFIKTSESFRKAEEILKGATTMSDAISKVYLVTTSMTDSFDTARRSGLSQETASYVSLFSMLGMYGFLQTDYMRGLLTNNKDYEVLRDMETYLTSLGRQNIKHLQNEGLTAVAENTLDEGAKLAWYKSLGKSIKNFWGNHINSVKTGKFDIKSGMLAEGLEELSEEAMQDAATMLSRGLQKVKSSITGKEYSDEYSWKNTDPLARYSSAFIGGAIGGGIFTTANKYIFQKDAYNHFVKTLGDRSALNKQVVDYIVAGKTSDLLKTLDKVEQGFLSDTITMEGESTTKPSQAQKTVVFNMMRSAIISMDSFIRSNSLQRKEGDFKNDVLVRAGWVKDNSIYDLMHNDYVQRVSELSEMEAKRQSLNSNLDSAQDSEKAAIREEIKKLDELMKTKKSEVEDLKNGAVEEYMGAIMLKANRFMLDDLIPSSKQAFAKLEYNMEYDELPTYAKKKIDEKFAALDAGGSIDLNVFKAWRRYKELNLDKNISASFKSITSEINSEHKMSEMSPEIVLMENIIRNLHIDSPLFKFLETDYQENARYNALSRLLLGQNVVIASNIFGKEFTAEQIATEAEFIFDLNTLSDNLDNYLSEYESKVIKAFEDISEESLSEEEQRERILIRATYGSLTKYKQVVENVRNALSGEMPGIDNAGQIQIVDDLKIDELINSILTAISSGHIDTVRELVNVYNQSREKFTLSEDFESQLKQIRQALNVVEALTLGADESSINELRTGANVTILEALESKGKKGELQVISSDAANVILGGIREYQLEIDFLLEESRKNRGQLISIDKTNSNKRILQKNSAIENLFSEFANGDKWGVWSEDIPKLEKITIEENASEEQLIEYNSNLRKNIAIFEEWFYKKWSSLTEDSKTDFVRKLFKYYFENDPSKIANTGTIEESVNTLTDSDFFKYLMLCCSDHQSEIQQNYANIIANSDKCPFDSQEEITITTSRMLFTSAENLHIWMEVVKEELGDLIKDYAGVYESFCTSLGLGGVGKSDVIIPSIIKIHKSISENDKIVLVVNTDIQYKEMQDRFKNSDIVPDEIILQSEWKEHVKKATTEQSTTHYIIDEFTNLSTLTLNEVQQIISDSKSQTKCIMFGDDTQVGEVEYRASKDNKYAVQEDVTMAICPGTLTQTTPVRTYTDVSRRNVMVLQNHLNNDKHGWLEFYPHELGIDDKFHYYDSGNELHGIQKDSKENIKNNLDNFIATHLGENQTLMIYTTDDIEARELTEKYKNDVRISVHTKIKSVQGSQWDYVINLWNQSLESVVCPDSVAVQTANENGAYEVQTLPVLNVDIIHPVMLGKAINTLFTRAKCGTISVPGTTWDWETELHALAPISIGLSAEAIDSYKTFKSEVFKLAYNFTTSSNSGEDGGSEGGNSGGESQIDDGRVDLEQVGKKEEENIPTEIIEPIQSRNVIEESQRAKKNPSTRTISPRSKAIKDIESECEFTTAWIPKSEIDDSENQALLNKLGLNQKRYMQFRSLLITSFMTGDRTLVQRYFGSLAGDWGLIRKSEQTAFKQDQLMPFGNPNKTSWGTDIDFGIDQTWLVYQINKGGETINLHIAFCHTNQATSEVGVKQTPLNEAVRSLPVEDTFVGLPTGSFRMYHRNTSFDVKTEMSERESSIQSRGSLENGILVDRSDVFIMSPKQSLDETKIPARTILKCNEELETAYKNLYIALSKVLGLNEEFLNISAEQQLQLREFIGRDSRKKTKPKGVIDIKNHFCQFIRPYTGSNMVPGNGSLQTAANQYLNQLRTRIKRVQDAINIVDSFGVGTQILNDTDKQLLIDKIEQLGVVSEEISLLSFSNGNVTNDSATIKRILESTDVKDRKSYASSINDQIIATLCAVEQVLLRGDRLVEEEHKKAYSELRNFCETRGIIIENDMVNWSILLSDSMKVLSENFEEGFSTLLWMNYVHRNHTFLKDGKWIWSSPEWSKFLTELYSREDIMSLLSSLKEVNDSLPNRPKSKLFRGWFEVDGYKVYRNVSPKVYKGLLVDNQLTISSSNSSVYSTSFGQFMSEGKFVQLARLCIFGKPSSIPGIVVTPNAQSVTPTPPPSPMPGPRRGIRPTGMDQFLDALIKEAVPELTNNPDPLILNGLKSFIKQHVLTLGYSMNEIVGDIREQLIEDLKDKYAEYCAPF